MVIKQKTEIKLKPCPFCGGKPKVLQWSEWSVTYEVEIGCRNEKCDAYQSARTSIRDGESPEKAYERAYQIVRDKWNRRTIEDWNRSVDDEKS